MLAFDIGTITVEQYHGTTANTANEFYSVYSNPSSLAVNHRYRPTRMRLSCLKVAVILSRVVVKYKLQTFPSGSWIRKSRL